MNQDQIEDAEAFRRSEMGGADAGERAWLAWCKRVESLIGHDLDGDGATEAGTSAAQAAAWIIQNRTANHKFSPA